jgi:phage shock protein PspC (stress-responsive transcriptional regulator)
LRGVAGTCAGIERRWDDRRTAVHSFFLSGF